MISVEVENSSGERVDEEAAIDLARRVLEGEGIAEGELGIGFVAPAVIAGLKAEHLGIDEVTDVLSFPIDAREEVPQGVPRMLGDVVLCPHVVGEKWREPLVHGVLHLLGYDHGADMRARERIYR